MLRRTIKCSRILKMTKTSRETENKHKQQNALKVMRQPKAEVTQLYYAIRICKWLPFIMQHASESLHVKSLYSSSMWISIYSISSPYSLTTFYNSLVYAQCIRFFLPAWKVGWGSTKGPVFSTAGWWLWGHHQALSLQKHHPYTHITRYTPPCYICQQWVTELHC